MSSLWILSIVTNAESVLARDLLMTSINRMNNYSKQNLLQCSCRQLTIVLRQTLF